MFICFLKSPYVSKPEVFFSLSISRSVVSGSLWPHGLQHARLPCPSLSPRVYVNSCPWSWWCHPTILSSVTPFSSYPQSFPASGSFPMSCLFASGSQNIGASASASVREYSGLISFRIDWFDLLARSSGMQINQEFGISRCKLIYMMDKQQGPTV